MDINYDNLSQRERFNIIYKEKVDKEVYEYLKDCFKELRIEIYGNYEEDLLGLMQRGALKGWCWQTTETSILFLEDDAYIERGNLKFTKYKNYYHSWIVFNYENNDYVLDSCLQILCRKDIYDKIFTPNVLAKVKSKEVKEYFIDYITNPPVVKLTKEEEEKREKFHRFLIKMSKEETIKKQESEIVIHDKEDVNAPMYRNGVGYKPEFENGKIKKLIAHYYINV